MIEEVRKAIEKLNLEFREGFRRGDAAAVAALYTDDAVLSPPNSEIIRGKHGIEKFWREASARAKQLPHSRRTATKVIAEK